MNKKNKNNKFIRTIVLVTLLLFCFFVGYYIAVFRTYSKNEIIKMDSMYEYCQFSKCNTDAINSTLDDDNPEIIRQTIFRGYFNFIDSRISIKLPEDWYVKYTKTAQDENYLLINNENSLDFANLYLIDVKNWMNIDSHSITKTQKEKISNLLKNVYNHETLEPEEIDNFNTVSNIYFGTDTKTRINFNYISSNDNTFRGFSYIDKNYFESIYYPQYYALLYSVKEDQFVIINYYGADVDLDFQKLNKELEDKYFNNGKYEEVVTEIDQMLERPRQDYSYGQKLNQIDEVAITLKSP